jgi:hypothetical protein
MKTVTVRGLDVTIQSLTRDEAMRLGSVEDVGEREACMIAWSIVEPFTLTVAEAQQLRTDTEPMELEEFTADIARLSGMDKKGKKAQNEAFKSVRE